MSSTACAHDELRRVTGSVLGDIRNRGKNRLSEVDGTSRRSNEAETKIETENRREKGCRGKENYPIGILAPKSGKFREGIKTANGRSACEGAEDIRRGRVRWDPSLPEEVPECHARRPLRRIVKMDTDNEAIIKLGQTNSKYRTLYRSEPKNAHVSNISHRASMCIDVTYCALDSSVKRYIMGIAGTFEILHESLDSSADHLHFVYLGEHVCDVVDALIERWNHWKGQNPRTPTRAGNTIRTPTTPELQNELFIKYDRPSAILLAAGIDRIMGPMIRAHAEVSAICFAMRVFTTTGGEVLQLDGIKVTKAAFVFKKAFGLTETDASLSRGPGDAAAQAMAKKYAHEQKKLAGRKSSAILGGTASRQQTNRAFSSKVHKFDITPLQLFPSQEFVVKYGKQTIAFPRKWINLRVNIENQSLIIEDRKSDPPNILQTIEISSSMIGAVKEDKSQKKLFFIEIVPLENTKTFGYDSESVKIGLYDNVEKIETFRRALLAKIDASQPPLGELV